MADTRTKHQRSRIMQSVGTEGTGPELTVRRLLHRQGYRYKLNAKHLPGSPDIVFPARKKVIFVNGCFWHSHGCATGQAPKSRLDYWLPKLQCNIERDERKKRELEAEGWSVLTVWQCEIKAADNLLARMVEFLQKSLPLAAESAGGS